MKKIISILLGVVLIFSTFTLVTIVLGISISAYADTSTLSHVEL